MQLLRLEVRNWCQHKYRECSFTRGLVAIIGRIGSGKSNLLGAICWLLTGENPNTGLKMDNVSQLAAEGEPSYAQLEFEHAGHTVVVKRHLLPEKEPATLLVDGVEAARGDKAVTAHIERLLGIDSKFISRFVIVAQNEIFAFIEDGASEVDKFFQKLFGTANAEKCQDVINKHLNKLVIPEVLEPSSLLATRKAALSNSIGKLSDEIAKLPTLEIFLQAQASQQQILNDWQERAKLSTALLAVETSIREYGKQLVSLTAACDQYDKDLAALSAGINGAQEESANAKAALSNLATYKQLAQAREAAAVRLAEIDRIRKSTPEPVAVTDADFELLTNSCAAAELELQSVAKFIGLFDASGVAECPTCHTPTANLVDSVDAAKKNAAALQQRLDTCRQKVAQATAARTARLVWEKQETQFAAEVQKLNEAANTFLNITTPTTDESDLLQTVANHEKLQTAHAELLPIAQREKENKATLAGKIENLTTQKSTLVAQIEQITVTQIDANLAQSALDVLSQQCLQRQNLEKQLAQLEFELTRLREQIAETEAAEQRAELLRNWTVMATDAKDALKLAPRLVAQRNLKRLELAVNDLLQVFGVDFLVKASEDESPTFVAEFFDGRRQPAKRLSYGQKTVLALAFRVAVNALFADQIGLLALDEPTAYLDQQRIKALAPVLERLRELSTARGLQCLLVTHETSLAHLFESAVELDA